MTCYTCGAEGHYAKNCPKRKGKSEQLFFSSFVAKSNSAHEWFIDSGASAHMTMSENNLSNLRAPPTNDIIIGNNSRLNVQSAGDVKIAFSPDNGTTTQTATVTNVLCIPDICANLMSVSAMTKRGCTLIFEDKMCKIFNSSNELIATAPMIDDLYKLNCSSNKSPTAFVAASKNSWHRRLGHSCDAKLEKVRASVNGIEILDDGDAEKCVICIKGKQTRNPFGDSEHHATGLLDVVYSDVGLMQKCSHNGSKCFVTFIDDWSRKVFLYPMKNKGEAFDKFVLFKNFAETQTGQKIKVLRTDNGTEYVNNKFDSLTAKNGILHQRTVPHTPEQNGVAERMNRTIVEKVRCILHAIGQWTAV